MSPDVIHIHDEGGDNRGRSQMEKVAQLAETPSLRRGKYKRPNYKECGDSDSEDSYNTDETNDGDIPAKKSSIIKGGAPRALRSQGDKQEPMSSEQQTPVSRVVIKIGKRNHGDHECEPARPAKRGRKPTTNTEIKRFEKDMLGLLERYASKANDLEASRSENQDLQAQIKILESKLEQSRQAHKQSEISCNQKIAQLKEDARDWRCQLASALDKLKKDSGKYAKVSDSEIKEKWMVLSYNIRGLVSQYLTAKPSDQDVHLKSLVMGHRLHSTQDISTLRASILRRKIWTYLIFAVFSGRESIWQGNIGATLTYFLSTNNYHHTKDVYYLQVISQIKARAVSDLSEEFHLNMQVMEASIDKMTDGVSHFIPKSKVKLFRKEMQKLIITAVDLHSIMMKSKAIFFTEWIGDDGTKKIVPYDQTKMTSNQCGKDFDTSSSFVKYVEAPGLVKIGNADGEDFDTSMVLCEASVILQEDDADIDKKDEGDKK